MIVRWFSHEVSDFEPVLSRLEAQDRNDFEVRTETRFCLSMHVHVYVGVLNLSVFHLSLF